MKLQKREITLNEEDSLFDMLCMEKTLLRKYEEGENMVARKECNNEAAALKGEAASDCERIEKLWKASKERAL